MVNGIGEPVVHVNTITLGMVVVVKRLIWRIQVLKRLTQKKYGILNLGTAEMDKEEASTQGAL